MSENENLTILREAYQLWNDSKANSMEHWLDLIADDIQWRSLANGAPGMEFTRSARGKDSVITYFQEMVSDWESLHYTVDEFIAQGDRIVVLCRCGWKHRKTGKTVESPKADIIRMKGGKIVEFFEFYDTAQAIAATQITD